MTPAVLRAIAVMLGAYLSWDILFPVVPEWGVYIVSILAVAAIAGAVWYVFATTRNDSPSYPSTTRARSQQATGRPKH